MKFRYIGQKLDGERAFKEKTGIEWMPGSVHDVTDSEVCAEMRKHVTIWEPVDASITLAAAAPKPYGRLGPVDDEEVDEEIDAQAKAKKAAEDSKVPAPTPEPTPEPTAAPSASSSDEAAPDLKAMEAPALHELAKSLGVKVHHAAGAQKVRDAIVAFQKALAKAKK